jgi:hypothetical protein
LGPVISFCKIFIPSYVFDVALCWNWLFLAPDRLSLRITLLYFCFCTGLNIVYNIGHHFVEPGGEFKWGSIHNWVVLGFQWMVCWLLLVHYAHILWGWFEIWSVQMVWQVQSESASTSAPIWMDGAPMAVPFDGRWWAQVDYFFSLPGLCHLFFFLSLFFAPCPL